MKTIILSLFLTVCASSASAQAVAGKSRFSTFYELFRPGIVHLANGKATRHPQLNIFLRNGRLLFRKGATVMQADMETISRVDFSDAHFVKVDSAMAEVIDTVGSCRLLRTTLIDMDAYRTQLINNREITDIGFGDQISFTAIDPTSEEALLYPLVNFYYFDLGKDIIRVNERSVSHALPKDKRRIMRTIMSDAAFSWSNPAYLKQLLELFPQ